MSYQFSTDGASGAAVLGILNKCFVQIFVDVEYKWRPKWSSSQLNVIYVPDI